MIEEISAFNRRLLKKALQNYCRVSRAILNHATLISQTISIRKENKTKCTLYLSYLIVYILVNVLFLYLIDFALSVNHVFLTSFNVASNT